MSERKLATIRTISEVTSIEKADRLEVAQVDGWKVVVRKGEFKANDPCVFLEIDSIVPSIPYFEFMKERKYRVKTIRLRKQISQGLVIPTKDIVKILNELIDCKYKAITKGIKLSDDMLYGGTIGEDLTELLCIKKYLSPSERESDSQGTPKKIHNPIIKFLTRFDWYRKLTHTKSKSFPEWIAKTDEERIQNEPSLLHRYPDKKYYLTEKIDGQSATYWYKKKLFGGEFGICSRTVRKFEHDNSNWSQVAKQFNIKEILKNNPNIAIQGEVVGQKIQGGHYSQSDKVDKPFDLFVFNVYDIVKKEYYDLYKLHEFCAWNKLHHVPILDYDFKRPKTVDEMVKIAEGKSVLADIDREGVVVRSHDKTISFKAINNTYLIHHEE